MHHEIIRIDSNQKDIVKGLLEMLPEWFGIPSAVDEYAQDAITLPTYGIYDGDKCTGILTLSYPSSSSTEIHLIAVHPSYHGEGIGTRLIRFAEDHAIKRGNRFLVVKTLGESHPDLFYQRTRQFYLKTGFYPLMELEGFWGANPCLVMAKALSVIDT